MDDLIAEFIAETREMLEALERALVAWERDPSDRAQFDQIFRFIHTVKGNCGFFDLPRIQALAHVTESALSEVRAGRRKADTRLVDAVLLVIDRIGEMIERVAAGKEIASGDDSELILALSESAPSLDSAAKDLAATDSAASVATKPRRQIDAQRTVRLPTNLVDRVMSGVSDMILVRNELERQLHRSDSDPAALASFGRLSALLTEMQSAMARVRLQPIQTLLSSYDRMIRDLAAELGKQVEVEIESGQVEIDREMIERLRDPLMHVIRNAIDHGFETPEQRAASGKPPAGRLLLSARQTGNEIRIAILDDGRGIDADLVVRRAVERGVVTPELAERMDQSQRLQLICAAGLSTARQVTGISGRGVGMDVVRAAIEKIGGKLNIASTPGNGTRLMFDVPLTLSVVPSITVEVGGQTFAVPRSYVREIVRNSSEVEVEPVGGARHVCVRGELYPCLGLAEVFGIAGEDCPDDQTLVMVTMIDGSVFALCVDGIADHCDLVIRPVAPQIIATGFYVGVAQLNDGRPSLMLDMVGVAKAGGIISDKSRFVSIESTNVPVDPASLTPMIVFRGLSGVRQATHLSVVEKLAEVPVADIGHGSAGSHLVFEGDILPLHGFTGDADTETIDVLVIASLDARFAYATAGSIDICDFDLETACSETGRTLLLYEDRAIELLDLEAFRSRAAVDTRPSCRLPSSDNWSQEVLRPLVEGAGFRVVDEVKGPIDLVISFESGDGETLRLEGAQAIPSADVVGIDRNDPEALTSALMAVSKRSAG